MRSTENIIDDIKKTRKSMASLVELDSELLENPTMTGETLELLSHISPGSVMEYSSYKQILIFYENRLKTFLLKLQLANSCDYAEDAFNTRKSLKQNRTLMTSFLMNVTPVADGTRGLMEVELDAYSLELARVRDEQLSALSKK